MAVPAFSFTVKVAEPKRIMGCGGTGVFVGVLVGVGVLVAVYVGVGERV